MTDAEEDQVFTSVEVCDAAGITYRQLDWWCRSDYVRPSVQQADGTGTRRLWSAADLERVREVRDVMEGPRRLAETSNAP